MSKATTNVKSLHNVVVAVEPISERSLSFQTFAKTIQKFQQHKVLPSTSVLSIIHSALYSVPSTWYREAENKYADEAAINIEKVCQGTFDYSSVEILKGKASTNHYLIEEISAYLKKRHSQLLVVLSSNRQGLPYWLVGSFAETAAFSATSSVLVIKPHLKNQEFSAKPRFTLALDASASYSERHLKWVVDLAGPANAHVDIISVKPGKGIFSSLKKPENQKLADKELKHFEKALNDAGISTSLSFIKEKESVPQTIVDFADKKKSWGIIAISTERAIARKLFLGSTARKVLTLTKRPFFAVRL